MKEKTKENLKQLGASICFILSALTFSYSLLFRDHLAITTTFAIGFFVGGIYILTYKP